MTATRSTASERVRIAAVVVLVLGWIAAAVVFLVAPAEGGPGSDGYRVVNGQAYATDDASSRELQQLERLGGKAAVLTFKFNRWFVSLWSGRTLAFTLAALALAAAAGCWHVATLMEEADTPRG